MVVAEKVPESTRVLRLVPAEAPRGREMGTPASGDDTIGEPGAQKAPYPPEGKSGPRSSTFPPGAIARGTEDRDLRDRDDAELVALAQAGQSTAFEALYRRHSPYALALAVRVQGNRNDVEDIVHDSFLKVHDRLDDLRAGSSFRAWLSSVVVSLVRTRLRRRRFFGVFGLNSDEGLDLEVLVSPDASPETRAQLAQVYTTLQSTSLEQRICWTLRYIEGRKLEDVAQIASCSLATAKRRISAVQELLLVSHRAMTPSFELDLGGHNGEE